MTNVGNEFIRKCQWDELDAYYTKNSVKYFLSQLREFLLLFLGFIESGTD